MIKFFDNVDSLHKLEIYGCSIFNNTKLSIYFKIILLYLHPPKSSNSR